MAQFIITYLGGNPPSSPEAGKKHYAEYTTWLASLGDAIVSPANPIKNTHTISPDGSINSNSNTAMSGYSIINAETIDTALALAKDCPFLDIGGTLEVSELIKMPG